jgi:hypothetical protein
LRELSATVARRDKEKGRIHPRKRKYKRACEMRGPNKQK